MFRAKHRVILSTRESISDSKGPTVLAHVRAHDSDIDEVLQTLENTRDKRTVGPWASVGDVEVVPPYPNVSSVPSKDWEELKLEVGVDIPFSGSYLLPLAIVSLKVLGRLLNEPSLSLGWFANDLAISD
jgi:hypothetical protein